MPETLFNKVAGLKETLAQVLSCEFSEISKNTFSQNLFDESALTLLLNGELLLPWKTPTRHEH